MPLPAGLSWVDAAFLATLSAVVLAWVQYFKRVLPENELVIRLFSLVSSMGWSYGLSQLAYLMKPATENAIPMPFIAVIVYGILAVIFGDFGYQFLSASKSEKFSLPSQTQLKENGTPKHIGSPSEIDIVAKKKEDETRKRIAEIKVEVNAALEKIQTLEKKD